MKTKNQTTTFYNYTPDFFNKKGKTTNKPQENRKSKAGKKFSQMPLWVKQLELEKKEIEKVRSFKAIALPDDEYEEAISQVKTKMSIGSDDELYKYLEMRWKDFCFDATTVLKDNLTFGNTKFGYKLNLGNINYAIFDRIVSRNFQCFKEVVEDEEHVGYSTHMVKFFKYHFVLECGFPSFECDRWWRNDMFPPMDMNDKPLQFAQYTSVTFVVNSRTNRVYCNWEMECCTMILRELEGVFLKTV